jgi:hypothetical protein
MWLVMGSAAPALADPGSSAASEVGGAVGFVIALGGMGVVAGPAFYFRMKRKYSLTDQDDSKDQAIGSFVVMREVYTRKGWNTASIKAHYTQKGAPRSQRYTRGNGFKFLDHL